MFPTFASGLFISPINGSVGATFTATDGTVNNETVVSRRWLLGGVAIGTGLTVASQAAGALVRENTAVGVGGTTVTTSTVVAVGAGGTGLITSAITQNQPGATLRFFQVTASRPFMLTGINNVGIIWDAANGIYSLNLSSAGNGSASGSVQVMLTITPLDGGGVVMQSVTVSLGTIAAPVKVSEGYTANLIGPAGTKLESLPGWATFGSSGTSSVSLDGSGGLIGDGSGSVADNAKAILISPSTRAHQVVTFGLEKGPYNLSGAAFFAAADGYNNGIQIDVWPLDSGPSINVDQFKQAGAFTGIPVGGSCSWGSGTTGTFSFVFSADGNSVTYVLTTAAGVFPSTPVDITGKTLGAKFGFVQSANSRAINGGPIQPGHRITSIAYSVQQTGLSVTSAPASVVGNAATWHLTWDRARIRPTALQHSFDGNTWLTGDSTINNDGAISYTGTAPRCGAADGQFSGVERHGRCCRGPERNTVPVYAPRF